MYWNVGDKIWICSLANSNYFCMRETKKVRCFTPKTVL